MFGNKMINLIELQNIYDDQNEYTIKGWKVNVKPNELLKKLEYYG